MQIEDIPQDNSKTYHGHRKIIYGIQNGSYQAATSSGWNTEAYATEQAVDELAQRTLSAREAVVSGQYSPLYYYMYAYRYDEISLSQTTGFWRWQIRRHFRPKVFFRLPEKILKRYAEAFGLPSESLLTLPERDKFDNGLAADKI